MTFSKLTILLLVAVLATTTAWPSVAEEPAGISLAAELEAEMATTAPVELDGNRLFRVRGISAYPAEHRAERIKDRIETLARHPDVRADGLRLVESDIGVKIMAGDQLVMIVFEADARSEGVRRPVLAAATLDRIRQAIADYRQARRPDTLLMEGLFSIGGTAVLAVAVALLLWLGRRTDELIARRMLEKLDYRLDDDAVATFREYVALRRTQPHFANARSIRNALDRARLRQANRLFAGSDAATREALSTITAADIRASRVFNAA